MSINWTSTGAVFGLLGVALGAYGAHGLEKVVEAPEALEWWDTAVRYHLVHAVLLVLVGLARLQSARSSLGFAGACLALGTLVFSGTLYAMALGAPRWLGAVTPFGGLALMIGWGALAVAARSLARPVPIG